jgi:hypothetical protein
MDKKSKFISGLKNGKIVRRTKKYFTETERHQIIQELLSSQYTSRQL